MRVPRHEPGPPETLTNTDYANLLRVSDRRTIAGKRDYALLGDCGLRSAARQRPPPPPLRARQGRPGARGPGPRGRPARTGVLDHGPSARPRYRAARRAAAVRPPRPPRRPGPSPPLRWRCAPARAPPLPCRRRARPARAPPRAPRLLGHPPARGRRPRPRSLRPARAVDLRTTARYAAPRPERVDEIADVLDRRHQAARRGWGA